MTDRPPAYLAYVRQSQARQDQEESLSLQYQESQIRAYAARSGGEVLAVYGDLDVSGAVESREGMDALLEHARTARPDAVAVYSLSRIARDTYLFLRFVRELDRLGIKVLSCTESTDDRTLLVVMAAFAERERIQLSNNVAYAIREQAKNGLVTQQPPYGYRRENGVLIPDENAPIVGRIFAEWCAGRTTTEIVAGLVADGIPSPYGVAWRRRTIRRMLERRTYIGEIAISETRDPSGRVRPAVIAPGKHEAIIDPATWQLAQRLLGETVAVKRKEERVLPWLSGVTYCAACGSRMYIGLHSRRSADGAPRWYVKCGAALAATDTSTPSRCPGQKTGTLALIEPVARQTLQDRLSGVVDAEAAYQTAIAQTSVSSDETRRTLASRRQRHMDRIDTLTEMRVNRELEADAYLRRRDVELAAIERIDAELATLPEPLPLPMYRAGALAVKDAAAAITGASDDELRRLVAILGARAFVDNRTRAVRWIFAAPYSDLMPG